MQKLLLHTCCAPCGSAVLEKVLDNFEITLFFYNPNIMPFDEYKKRLVEVRRLALIFGVGLIEGDYDCEAFLHSTAGLETEREGGRRCEICMRLRLQKTAEFAVANGFDRFTTTLSVSPHKNFAVISGIIAELDPERGFSQDFKKQDGYKRSVELSKEHGFYRQNYCGCNYF
ncbi:MAG: epoxyqueuosine reductase QueH [Oscillospiraceae bacterium]|nr:epoxyqueuosine reductase QueH [Oscillospiraceae bacterium]